MIRLMSKSMSLSSTSNIIIGAIIPLSIVKLEGKTTLINGKCKTSYKGLIKNIIYLIIFSLNCVELNKIAAKNIHLRELFTLPRLSWYDLVVTLFSICRGIVDERVRDSRKNGSLGHIKNV